MIQKRYSNALKFCEDDMIKDLLVTDVLPELRTCKSFTLDDEEIIYHEKTSSSKVIKLLEIINKKDEEVFEKFRDVLRTTNEDIAEMLEKSINNEIRERRNSNTDFGNILVLGGVPDRRPDYIHRAQIEKQIMSIINQNGKKPILIHGTLGCGKTNIVTNLIYSSELFPFRFTNCCWMPVGAVNKTNIVRKLTILWNKLYPDRNSDTANINPEILVDMIPEVLMESIKQRLQRERTLLILDDIRSEEMITYFTFPVTYIVTSQNSRLFPDGCAELVQIPDRFTDDECRSFIGFHEVDNAHTDRIIQLSKHSPLYLSLICNLLKSNADFNRLIGDIEVNKYTENIIKEYIDILDDKTKKYYEMLAIVQYDETVTLEVLSIYWDLKNVDALQFLNTLCDNNFLYKNWIAEYKKNMYGIYGIHLDYLKKSKAEELETYQNMFISRYTGTYTSWLDINNVDPFFLTFYVKTLFNRSDFKTLSQLYSDYSFITAKIVLCGIADLLLDYDKFFRLSSNKNCHQFEKFLMKYSHKFIKLPDNKDIILKMGKVFTKLIQLGLYEMKDSCTYRLACEAMCLSKRRDFWDWINPKSSIKIWETSQEEDIIHVDVNETRILMCTKNGRVRLLDSNNGNCIFDYKISDEIIFVQFISAHSFIIVDSNIQFWLFGQNNLTLESLRISDNDYDDDSDFQSKREESVDITLSKETFQNLLTKDFIKRCHSHKIKTEKQPYNSLQAIQFLKEIVLLYIGESSTYVAIYDFQARLKHDFIVEFSIKKLKLNQNLSSFYALKEDTGEIILIDEFGCSTSTICIKKHVILDFTVVGDDIFCAAQNKMFKYPNLIFTVDKLLSITKISISVHKTLLALCLTNDSIQIWNYSEKELLYSLNDSQFTEVYFQSDTNYLITTGQTNVAKWDMNALSSNSMNNNLNGQSLFYYHPNFIMHNLSSSLFVLVLQSFKNYLHFCFVENGIIKPNVIEEDLEVSCFFCFDRYVFIGFVTDVIKIFDLSTFHKIQQLDSLGEVKNIHAFAISEDTIGFVVYHSGNQITIFHLLRNTFTVRKIKESTLPAGISVNKFFLIDQSHVILAIICDKKCLSYKINLDECLPDREYSMNGSILDADISNDNQHFCAISTAGEVKIWEKETDTTWCNTIENGGVLRKCAFRPKSDIWSVVATINDEATIYLVYFCQGGNLTINKIIEDFTTKAIQLPRCIKWTTDSVYLLVGDYDIRKLKIPVGPLQKYDVKLPLTKLQTYFGGIQHIHLNDNYICTVDRQGFFYVLKKLD